MKSYNSFLKFVLQGSTDNVSSVNSAILIVILQQLSKKI